VRADGLNMSTREDHGGPFAGSLSSRFTAVNGKDQSTIVVSMNGISGAKAPRRSSSPDEMARAHSITASTSPMYGEEWMRRDEFTQADRQRRKRKFSNRTKTGCMTCRRRKKKCDEARLNCKTPLPLNLPNDRELTRFK
jgi:hypothetical protein